MYFYNFCIYLLILIGTLTQASFSTMELRRQRRSPSAFHLAYLQRGFEEDEDRDHETHNNLAFAEDGNVRRDEVVSDEKCLKKCNEQLTIGMDMVNAHMAFGSIDVPSVVEETDLALFCSLDRQHSKCIDECGYSVQFNLREYVCRQRKSEMKSLLPCYARAAPALMRHCRPRCGGYKTLEHSLVGYASRCRQLLCDHTCTDFLLRRICVDDGVKAANFLLDFTKLQNQIKECTVTSPYLRQGFAKVHSPGAGEDLAVVSCRTQRDVGAPYIFAAHHNGRVRMLTYSMRFKNRPAFCLNTTAVEFWIRDFARQTSQDLQKVYPNSCRRLQCPHFDSKNCSIPF